VKSLKGVLVRSLLAPAALITLVVFIGSTNSGGKTYSADQCSGVIVGVECIGTVVSGTGNAVSGGGINRPRFLSIGI